MISIKRIFSGLAATGLIGGTIFLGYNQGKTTGLLSGSAYRLP
jgi:hypothetical protein